MKPVDKFIVVLVILWLAFAISVHKIMSSRKEPVPPAHTVQTETARVPHAQETQAPSAVPQPDVVQLNDVSREEYFADPITLYSGSFANIRQILAAEQQFFDENGRYTENIGDMKLAFQHVRMVNAETGKVWFYLNNNYF